MSRKTLALLVGKLRNARNLKKSIVGTHAFEAEVAGILAAYEPGFGLETELFHPQFSYPAVGNNWWHRPEGIIFTRYLPQEQLARKLSVIADEGLDLY